MSKRAQLNRIALPDLPPQGEDYALNRKSGELNETLKDIISDRDYEISIHIKPIGNVYEISGRIQTEVNTQCSRCGRDALAPINDQFSELIVIEEPRPRKGSSSSHEGHSDGPFCNYVTSPIFNLAEFCHEHIAAAEPYLFECGRPDCADTYKRATTHTEAPEFNKTNPFQALKKVFKNKSDA
jgi:uncharacterized metal-binding protein YceD (DUF177 family)